MPLTYAKAIDHVLRPDGFDPPQPRGRGRAWPREAGGREDCIVLQHSVQRGFTANLSTRDLITSGVIAKVVPAGSPGLKYPTTIRIGSLMEGFDRWWINDPDGPTDLASQIQNKGLPFLGEFDGLEAQAERFGRASKAWGNASTQMHLAVTVWRLGEVEEACAFLDGPPRWLSEAWKSQFPVLQTFFRSTDPGSVGA